MSSNSLIKWLAAITEFIRFPRFSVIIILGVYCLGLITAGSVSARPRDWEPALRTLEYHTLPEFGVRIAVDIAPRWRVNVQPNVKGKYPVVVVSSPANYTPFAEMHFIPFWDVKMQSLGVSVDEGAVIFLREMAEKYKIDRSAVNLDNLEKADFGSLSGYSVIVESREEKGTDMQFFLGSGTLPSAVGVEDTFRHGDLSKARRGDGNGIIFIAVIAQSGRLQDLRHVIRRSWSNSGYLY